MTNSRFTCFEKAVLLTSSFRAVPLFFADSNRKKGFQPMKSPYFCVSQQRKKNRSKRIPEKNRFLRACKPAIKDLKIKRSEQIL